MTNLSFQVGSARIDIEAKDEKSLAAYLGFIVYESVSIGPRNYNSPGDVHVSVKDPDNTMGLCPIQLETPEHDAWMKETIAAFSSHPGRVELASCDGRLDRGQTGKIDIVDQGSPT